MDFSLAWLLAGLFLISLGSGTLVSTNSSSPFSFPTYFCAFGNVSRAETINPVTGQILFLSPNKGCQLPSVAISNGTIAGATENAILQNCTTMREYYELIQANRNITFILIGARDIVSSSRTTPLGEGPEDNPGSPSWNVSIPVTYIALPDLQFLESQDQLVTLDSDLGQYYNMATSRLLLVYKIIFPTVYFASFLYAFYYLSRDIFRHGVRPRASQQIFFAIIIFALGRAFYEIFFEETVYFRLVPRDLGEAIGVQLLYWVPLYMGTHAYTMNLFAWFDIVTQLQYYPILMKLRLPALILFYSMVPLSILIVVLFSFLNLGMFLPLGIILIVMGLIEIMGFIFFGCKVISFISDSPVGADFLSKRLSIFLSASIFLWLGIVLTILIIYLITLFYPSAGLVLGFSVLRESLCLAMGHTIFWVIRERKLSHKSSKGKTSSFSQNN